MYINLLVPDNMRSFGIGSGAPIYCCRNAVCDVSHAKCRSYMYILGTHARAEPPTFQDACCNSRGRSDPNHVDSIFFFFFSFQYSKYLHVFAWWKAVRYTRYALQIESTFVLFHRLRGSNPVVNRRETSALAARSVFFCAVRPCA